MYEKIFERKATGSIIRIVSSNKLVHFWETDPDLPGPGWLFVGGQMI